MNHRSTTCTAHATTEPIAPNSSELDLRGYRGNGEKGYRVNGEKGNGEKRNGEKGRRGEREKEGEKG